MKLEDVRKIPKILKGWMHLYEEIDLNNLIPPKMSDKRVEYWDDFKNNEELVEDEYGNRRCLC